MECINEAEECLCISKGCDALRRFRMRCGTRMELDEREVTVDPGDVSAWPVVGDDLLHRFLEGFAVRAVDVGIRDDGYGSGRISDQVV